MTAKRIQLHESTQRGLARFAFLLVGAAPLLFCVYLCVATLVPGYQRRQAVKWQQELSSRIGSPVLVERATATAPHSYQLSGVKLLLPDGKNLAATIDVINIDWDPRGHWNIALHEPNINLERFGNLCRSVFAAPLSSGLRSMASKLVIQAEKMQIEDESISIHDLRLSSIPQSEYVGLNCEFRTSINGRSENPSNGLVAVLGRSVEDQKVQFQLQANSPIPCSAVAKVFQFPASLGKMQSLQQSQFAGVLDIRSTNQESSYYFRNSIFQNVDIAQFTGGPEAVLSGSGTLRVDQAKFTRWQLEWLQGSLELGPGKIDAVVLESLSRHLNIMLTRRIAGSVGFDRLTTNFTFLPDGLAIHGDLSEAGCILRDAQGVLAYKAETAKLPLLSLIQALVPRPDQMFMVPRTTPLIRTALIWLPLEESQRKQAELAVRR